MCSIASGSSGNCTYISTQTTTILVDEGAPVTRVEKCLRVLGKGNDLSLLITHAHADHISGAPIFAKRNCAKVYCHHATADALKKKGSYETGQVIEFGDGPIIIGDITVEPFKVSHDVPCVGFVFSHGAARVGIATDIGHVGQAVLACLSRCNLVIIESNHDEGMLRASKNYSPWLKSRILSASGHLSNDACAETCVRLAQRGVGRFVLAHLSEENNYPELALSCTGDALKAAGFDDVKVEVAGHYKMSSLYEIS